MSKQAKDTSNHILAIGRGLTARQGYAGVGLNELLKAAEVRKSPFYHCFASKEAYGCALPEDGMRQYREDLDRTLLHPHLNARERFPGYFENWLQKQTGPALHERCLVVKLSAGGADLSEGMSNIRARRCRHNLTSGANAGARDCRRLGCGAARSRGLCPVDLSPMAGGRPCCGPVAQC